jgi:hypothetical protein
MYGDNEEQLHKTVSTAEETTVQRLLQGKVRLKDKDIRVSKKPDSENGVGLGNQILDTTEYQQSVFDENRGQGNDQLVFVYTDLCGTQARFDSNMFNNNIVSPQYKTITVIRPPEVEFREFYFSNGDHYRGYCLRGHSIPHGQGVKTSTGNFVHEGNYKNGLYHGFGKITIQLPCRSTENPLISYEGGFQDGHYHGEGKATYWYPASAALSSQDFFVLYVGGWSWGERNGHGNMLYFSGAQYDGGWKRGVRHGQGTFTWANRYYYYDGGWKDEKKSGYGLLLSGDGSRYEGGWLDDEKYGHGINTKSTVYEYEI